MNATPKKLTAAEVEFEFTAEPELDSPDGQFCEPEDVKWVYEQLARGNDAAWFCAKVVARWKGFEGVDYLGGCSYHSFAEFERGDYFTDMKAEALDKLNRRIAETATKIMGRM